jgi:hypothetical protein
MEVDLNHVTELLSRTPSTLRTLLHGLPSEWTHSNEGENTWSPFDVVGHLIHGEETDWIPRARIILEFGPARAFEPFDRQAQFATNKGKTLEELLDTFAALRQESLAALKGLQLQPEDLQKLGMHPELGHVTLGELLATWGAHDLAHLAQISRTMARQYRDAVGPWQEYLSVMK